MNDLRFAVRQLLNQLLKNSGFTVHPPQCRRPDRVQFPKSCSKKPRHLRQYCYGGRAAAVLTLAFGLMISRSVRPCKSNLLFAMQPPDDQAGRHDPNHCAHSLDVRVEASVQKDATDKVRRLILADSQNHQAVPGMTEAPLSKAQIPREERRTGNGQQKGKNLLVSHALATQFDAHLPDGNAPASQQLALALQDVFIEDVHVPQLHREFMGVFSERLPGCAHGLRDGFLGDAASPFFNDAFPGHARRDLLQHVRHENPRAPKRRLPMADFRIGDDVTAHDFLSHTGDRNTPSSSTRQRSALSRKNRMCQPIQPIYSFNS